MPGLALMNVLTGSQCKLRFREDNQAMIRVCETGKNPTMRHIGRTHGVSVAWLFERFQEDENHIGYCDTGPGCRYLHEGFRGPA